MLEADQQPFGIENFETDAVFHFKRNSLVLRFCKVSIVNWFKCELDICLSYQPTNQQVMSSVKILREKYCHWVKS